MLRYMIIAVWILCCLGCSKSTEPNYVNVSGVVTVYGEPLADAKVMFVPIQLGAQGRAAIPISFGMTDEEGRYDLSRPGGVSGAVSGWHQVLVSKVVHPVQLAEKRQGNTKLEAGEIVLPSEAELAIRKDRLWGIASTTNPTQTCQPRGETVFVGFNEQTDLRFEVPISGTSQADFEVGRDPMLQD